MRKLSLLKEINCSLEKKGQKPRDEYKILFHSYYFLAKFSNSNIFQMFCVILDGGKKNLHYKLSPLIKPHSIGAGADNKVIV